MSMNDEPALLDNPLACIQHQLADIARGIDALHDDLQVIRALVEQREDLETRLWHLERMMHNALMNEHEDGDGYSESGL